MDKKSIVGFIYGSNGNLISVPLTRISYFFSSKNTDRTQLDIESSDPWITDIPGLQNFCSITVEWGYLEGPRVRKQVTILDRSEEFTETGVCLQLFCYPKGMSLQLDTGNGVYSGTFDEVANKIAEEHGLEYVSLLGYSDPIITTLEETKEEINQKFGISKLDNELAVTGYSVVNIMKPGETPDNRNNTTAVDNTSAPLNTYTFVQGNKSKLSMLNDYVNKEPGGPFAVVVSDNKLIKKKIDTGSPRKRSYYWKGGDGELLKFHLTTKNKENLKDAMNTNIGGWDKETKTYLSADFNASTDKTPRLGKSEPYSPKIKGASSNVGIPLQSSSQGTVYTIGEDSFLRNDKFGDIKLPTPKQVEKEPSVVELLESQEDVGTSESSNPANSPWNPQRSERQNGDITYVKLDARLSNTGQGFGPEGQIRGDVDNVGVERKAMYNNLGRLTICPGNPDKDGYGNDASANRTEAALDTNTVEATILGDPLVENHVISAFYNVGKKNSGDWYIIKANHIVEVGQGYIVNLTLSKNASEDDSTSDIYGTTDEDNTGFRPGTIEGRFSSSRDTPYNPE